MSKPTISQKRKQLKQLVAQLNTVLTIPIGGLSQKAQNLIAQIKQLLLEVRFFMSTREVSRILGSLAVVLGFSLDSTVQGQSFAAPVTNPFGLVNTALNAVPTFGDLDNDGDLDLLVTEGYGVVQYFKNIGTKTTPQFASPITDPFGISLPWPTKYLSMTALVDLDGDGDLDIMAGDPYSGDFRYQKNSGSKTVPQFDSLVLNPMGLVATGSYSDLTFVDLDNDGDLDMLVGVVGGAMEYYQNIGSKTAPMFAAPVTNPFGLRSVYNFALPGFADLDKDGDMDLLVVEDFGTIMYFKNKGSKTAPSFDIPVTNYFGLTLNVYYAFLAFADLDDDGDMDLLVGQDPGIMLYFENTSSPVGLNETPAFELALFPNPATTYFDLTSNTEVLKVEIMDAAGKVVSQQLNPSDRISVDGLPAGSYLVKVYNRDEQAVIQKLNKF